LLADSRDRRRLLIVTQFGMFVVATTLVVLTVAGAATPLVLYIGTALLAVFTSVDNPTRQALVPNLVPRHLLTNALALNSTQRQFGQIAGPSIAGLVLAAFGPAPCYAVEAASRLATLKGVYLDHGRPETLPGRG